MGALPRIKGAAIGISVAAAALVLYGLCRHLPSLVPSKRVPAAVQQSHRNDIQQRRRATITLAGDIMLGSRIGRLAAAKGVEHLFAEVEDLLCADGLTIANLECAVTTRGTPAEKKYVFRANPALLPGLRISGIDAVSLANNHSLDYGPIGLQDTLKHLRGAGIAAAGAGADIHEAHQAALLAAGRQTVALIAASRVLPTAAWYASANRPGVAAAYDPSRLLDEIKAVRPAFDIVMVYLHWGKEHALRPQPSQRALARQCIDAGADLVVGAHPHVLQGFEYHRGKLIAYSLGNFVFGGRDQTTALLQATFEEGALRTAAVIPCRIINCRPHVISDPAQRERVLRDLQARSFGVRISADGSLSADREQAHAQKGSHQ